MPSRSHFFFCMLLAATVMMANPAMAQKKTLDSLTWLLSTVDSIGNAWTARRVSVLENIRKQLRVEWAQDKKLISIIDNLKLDALSVSFNKSDRINAHTDQETITIDQSLSVIMVRSSKVARQIIASQARVGWLYPSEDEIAMLSEEIEGTMLSWLFLHEISHQYFDHLKSGNKCSESLAQNRTCELQADSLSFVLLNDCGHSLYLVERYYSLMESIEKIKIRYKKNIPEEHRSHPSWVTRASHLRNFLANDHPVPGDYTGVYSVFLNTNDTIEKYSMFVPFDENNHMGFTTMNNTPLVAFAAEHIDADRVNLYFRKYDSIMVYELSGKHRYVSELLLKNRQDQLPFYLYRDSFAGLAVTQLDSYATFTQSRAMLGGGLRAEFKDLLSGLAVDANQRQIANATIDKMMDGLDVLFLNYYKGLITSHYYKTHERNLIFNAYAEFESCIGKKNTEKILEHLLTQVRMGP